MCYLLSISYIYLFIFFLSKIGATLNPIAPDKTPGGSSNGSASAVSMSLVDIALGSDTFGSVRVPAHY